MAERLHNETEDRNQQPDRAQKQDLDALANTVSQVATVQSTSVELSRLVSREEREVEVTITLNDNKE